MLPRRNPLLEKLPQRVRDVILAIVVIFALTLPELRPVLTLLIAVGVPIGVSIIIGFVLALPVLLPPLRRAGQRNPSVRRAELVGFGVLTFVLVFIAALVLLPTLVRVMGAIQVIQSQITGQTYLILAGVSCLPAVACVNFVWRFTATDPTAPEAPE